MTSRDQSSQARQPTRLTETKGSAASVLAAFRDRTHPGEANTGAPWQRLSDRLDHPGPRALWPRAALMSGLLAAFVGVWLFVRTQRGFDTRPAGLGGAGGTAGASGSQPGSGGMRGSGGAMGPGGGSGQGAGPSDRLRAG